MLTKLRFHTSFFLFFLFALLLSFFAFYFVGKADISPSSVPVDQKQESTGEPTETQENLEKTGSKAFIAAIEKEVDEKRTIVPSEEEKKRASMLLSFYNQAENAFDSNWFKQADLIAFFVRIYLGEWQLPLLPEKKTNRSKSIQELTPPKGLFSETISEDLKKTVATMADELAGMRTQYAALLGYVQDASLCDEGRKGKELASQLTKAYGRFSQQRQHYFQILEKETAEAEALFIAEMPLRRQIIAAKHIFKLFRSLSLLLGEEVPCRPVIMQEAENLAALVDYASLPPFKGTPAQERLYRNFLKKVYSYCEDLTRGIREGFFPHVRKLLNDDLANVRSAYNAFVERINK
ncbi:MAG: hypothetical protein J5803_04250 [Desulfovibrio sp.]|nr:hypothetical protein [Desulfovibrio sp.]